MQKKGRIEVVDSLRGFAVMAIMLLHCLERFNLYIFPSKDTLSSWMISSDQAIWDTSFFLFGGKAYAIFALLFGFTFYLQNTKSKRNHIDFGKTFLWRMLLLVGFAFFNALFFPGDVLLLFSVMGAFLVLVRKSSPKTILWLSLFFLMQPIELIQFIVSKFNPDFTTLQEFASGIVRTHMGALKSQVREAGVFTSIWNNFYHGQIFSFMWAVGNGRWIQTLGLFLLGIYLGESQLFAQANQRKKTWRRVLIISIVSFIPLYYITDIADVDYSAIAARTIANAITMWKNLAFTAVLVSLFVLLYQTPFQKVQKQLHNYGRMSLTNYISQSVLGFILFFPALGNLSPIISNTYALLLGVVLFVLQLTACNYWLKTHKQGPLEALWHKGTWMFARK
ncbi:DUF418 domain-containing protein [Carboxylicivirga linearis]|uniref:DUF418 domain-containing protein n=1 Tax=Carboxylicivirga linearis TaxID=1628157 RepID=A0ABS5K1M7_9BACT|nr:DUF418 domain-containing protein [Carboxylicivirga linearis]MBS2101047.1 DUF418 domain-containing protein [Carboxylicivirga linearis]